MILLNGQSLTPAGQFEPEAMGLNLEERKSTATMQLGPSAPDIAVGAWLLDNTAPGAGIVWRVKSCDTTYNTKTRNYQLEHVINTLKDRIMFGEIKPEDMGGSGGNCTARQAAQYIINQQSIWALGDFEYNVSNPYQFNGDNLYAALETVTASLEDAVWEYDLTQLPFIIHIRQLSSDVTSEMREGRNIQSLKRTVDRSKMFTRFYPIGENNLHISGNYVSRNEDVYGTVSKVETDQSKTTQGQLLAWANERISRHCEPSVTVTVQGIDYSQATGEPLDNIRLNKKCRVPLPEYSTTIVETVKKLSWPDKIKEPKRFTVTLANVLEDVASIINRESERSAAGGRGGAAKNEKDHAWFVDTDTHVGMVAEAIAGSIDGHPNWSRVAQLMVDGNGVDARVTRAEGDIVTHTTQISMNDTAIRAEATTRQSETSSLSGQLTVEAGKVAMVVGTRTTQSGEENYIKAGEITLAINNAGESEAHIDANKVYIGNDTSTTVIAGKLNTVDVTANYIQGKISDITILSANALSVAGGINGSGTLTVAGLTTLNGSLRFGSGNTFNKCIVSAVNKGGTLTLTDSAGDVVNFSKATSLDGTWSSGHLAVTSDVGGLSYDQYIIDSGTKQNLDGTTYTSGTTWYVPVNAKDSPNGTASATGCRVYVNVGSMLEEKTVTATFSQQVITPTSGKTGMSKVTINGATEYHVKGEWGKGNESNKLLISRDSGVSTNTLTYVITASSTVTWNSTTKKFDGVGKALVDGAEKNNATASSGVVSLNAGNLENVGTTSGKRKYTVKNGSTEILSEYCNDYGTGFYAGMSSYTAYNGGSSTQLFYAHWNGSKTEYLSAGTHSWYYK